MAFVVVGFIVVDVQKTGDGLSKRDIQISKRFETKAGAEAYRDLARKSLYPTAEVREVMKHDDLN